MELATPPETPTNREVCAAALKVALGTAAFALLHSALASRSAKQATERVLGERKRNALYRPIYNAQAFVTLGVLWIYVRPLPDRCFYHVRGPLRWLLHVGQAAGVATALAAARQVGLLEISGLRSLVAWLRGQDGVPSEPEAQGPAPGADGQLRIAGPFRWSRHPLNLSPLPMLWLMPRMTVKLAAFNTVATLYFVLGSRHEEARLEEAYGAAYRAYQHSGCPFFLPIPRSENATASLPETEDAPPS